MFGAIPISLLLEIASANGKYTQLSLELDTPPEYDLPEEYFSSIQTGYKYMSPNSGSQCSFTESVDHPGFANLRNILESSGYIHTERSWSNGDTVLKPFRLNNKWFDVGDKFPSACAIGYLVA